MTVTSLRMSRCFPERAEVMAWYRLYRGIDRRDVAEAHALALIRGGPPATYVISASTPFQREDCDQLLHDAPTAIERRRPGLIEQMAAKGWQPPSSIDRVYDSGLAARISRQSSMASGMDVAGANMLADLEQRPNVGILACSDAAAQPARGRRQGERGRHRRRASRRLAVVQFLRRDESVFHDVGL